MERFLSNGRMAGANQQGVREHNARLIMSLIQRSGALPGSDIARLAGLSPQTISVILRDLETDGFLSRGEPQRGRVGKPRVPMRLAPEAVHAYGLKIGRRSADLVLVDFTGTLLARRYSTYRYPMPGSVLGFLSEGIAELGATLPQGSRPAGIGIGQPWALWDWHELIGAPAEALAEWRDLDLVGEIGRFTSLPVFLLNDATAAAQAERIAGIGRDLESFAHFYVGAFIGGGLVLDGKLFEGPRGNAGAFGSLLVRGPAGEDRQLLNTASLYQLEAQISDAGGDPSGLWTAATDWSEFEPHLGRWLDQAGREIARAALTVSAVIDVETVVIDGAFPGDVRDRLVALAADELSHLDHRGLPPVLVVAGSVGADARALGAALMPIRSQYLMDL